MELIKLLFKKAKEMDSYDKLDNLIEIAGKNAKHNLTTKQIEALASRYLSDDVDFKTSQLKGSDDYLNGIYYYNPSVKSIQKYSNILRSDLGLSKITDKDDFLDERVIKHYGSLVPLTELEESLLRKNQKDSTASNDDKESSNQDNSANQTNNQQNENTGNTQYNNDANNQSQTNSAQTY
ncbi:hypothetical protein SLVCU148_0819 [Staphylococcus lugdunensis VCU148]|nr:hypothetical protein SLVCU148_0819 [Staphylococcus lugdunensis VCU148]